MEHLNNTTYTYSLDNSEEIEKEFEFIVNKQREYNEQLMNSFSKNKFKNLPNIKVITDKNGKEKENKL